jgi:site-specific recombinase XerD
MSSIKLVLRCDKINKNSGKAPLYLRVIKDRKTRFISLGQQLEPKFWDEDKQKVKKAYQNSARMNAFLAQKIAEAEQKVLEESQKNRNISTKQLKTSIVGKEPPKFFEYAYKKVEMMRTSKKTATCESYLLNLIKFENFFGTKDVYFEDITVSVLKDYEHYLITKLNNQLSTVSFAFRILKIFFNLAIDEDVIPITVNPTRKYSIKFKQTPREYLREEQYQKLLEYKTEQPTRKIVLDMFLFSTYAGGLRFIDLLTIKWENYDTKEKRFSKVIEKTSHKHQFRLPEQAVKIIEKYRTKDSNPDDYIFPLLKKSALEKKPFHLLKKDLAKNGNRHLRDIGKILELPFRLTFHIARHTFATRALSKGMRIEYVSKILDHATIKQTQVYAKIINSDLDNAMDNIFSV